MVNKDLQGYTRFCKVLLVFMRFFKVLKSFTYKVRSEILYKVLQGSSSFCKVF